MRNPAVDPAIRDVRKRLGVTPHVMKQLTDGPLAPLEKYTLPKTHDTRITLSSLNEYLSGAGIELQENGD